MYGLVLTVVAALVPPAYSAPLQAEKELSDNGSIVVRPECPWCDPKFPQEKTPPPFEIPPQDQPKTEVPPSQDMEVPRGAVDTPVSERDLILWILGAVAGGFAAYRVMQVDPDTDEDLDDSDESEVK